MKPTVESLHRQLREALKAYSTQAALLEKFTLTFAPSLVANWMEMIVAWNEDFERPCPYEEEHSSKRILFTRRCRRS